MNFLKRLLLWPVLTIGTLLVLALLVFIGVPVAIVGMPFIVFSKNFNISLDKNES